MSDRADRYLLTVSLLSVKLTPSSPAAVFSELPCVWFLAVKLAMLRVSTSKVSRSLTARQTFVSRLGGKTVIEYFQAVASIKGQLITAFVTSQKSFLLTVLFLVKKSK